eukprot:g9443.t1
MTCLGTPLCSRLSPQLTSTSVAMASTSARRASRLQEELQLAQAQTSHRVAEYSASELPWFKFLRFMKDNQPVLISGLAQTWRASSDWVVAQPADTQAGQQRLHGLQAATARPNLAYLRKHFGDASVNVAQCESRCRVLAPCARPAMPLAPYTLQSALA